MTLTACMIFEISSGFIYVCRMPSGSAPRKRISNGGGRGKFFAIRNAQVRIAIHAPRAKPMKEPSPKPGRQRGSARFRTYYKVQVFNDRNASAPTERLRPRAPLTRRAGGAGSWKSRPRAAAPRVIGGRDLPCAACACRVLQLYYTGGLVCPSRAEASCAASLLVFMRFRGRLALRSVTL